MYHVPTMLTHEDELTHAEKLRANHPGAQMAELMKHLYAAARLADELQGFDIPRIGDVDDLVCKARDAATVGMDHLDAGGDL